MTTRCDGDREDTAASSDRPGRSARTSASRAVSLAARAGARSRRGLAAPIADAPGSVVPPDADAAAVVAAERTDPAARIADNLADVTQRIARACDRVRRDPSEVRLVGVTKTVPVERVRDALDAGLSHLGENRVQEAIPKMKLLADRAPTWHLIGHLQRNKARIAAELFDVIESVDSLALARVLEEDVEETGRDLRVFVQVNVGDEQTKHGVALRDVKTLVRDVDEMPSIRVVGLMAVPPRRARPEDSRDDFRRLREVFESLRADRPEIEHLSMGMSADFELAIEEGATEVRVGTALFGAR